MLGGNPHLASEFARLIVDFDERIVNEDKDSSGVLPGFVFSDETITLGDHHGDGVKIGLRQAMEYITSECDRSVVLEQPFIKENMRFIKLLAEHTGNQPVRLLDFIKESPSAKKEVFDKSTWNGEDYSDLAFAIIRCLVNHANHQQRCENYVQAMGLISQTNIDKGIVYISVFLENKGDF